MNPNDSTSAGQRVELLEERVVEHAAGLVAGQRLVPVGRHVERVPADDHRRRLLRVPQAQEEVARTPTSASAGRPPAPRIDFGSAW